jgi:hypothetical protein
MGRLFLLTTTSLLFCCIGAGAQVIPGIHGWLQAQQAGGTVLRPQPVAGDSRSIVYFIQKPVAQNQNSDNWFMELVTAELHKAKYTETQKGVTNTAEGISLYITEIKDSSAQKWYACYMAYLLSNRQVRLARVVSSADAGYFQSNTQQVSQHFANLCIQERKAPPTVPEKEKATVVKPAPAAPGKEVSKEAVNSSVQSIIMHLEYESGMGGGIYPVYNPYVLFKNGDLYKEPLGSLASLDIAASKTAEPKKWGTWKMNGSQLVVYWPEEKPKYQNSTWEKSSYKNVQPAKKGELLQGSFKSISGGGNTAMGGDLMIVMASNISFNSNGQFTLAKVTGSSDNNWTTSSNSNEAGSYRLDGYAIELKYNNGKTEQRLFYFYPDSRQHFGIGGNVYMPKRN